ncbi:hypothetical protein D3C71_1876450 [compost metagenome]
MFQACASRAAYRDIMRKFSSTPESDARVMADTASTNKAMDASCFIAGLRTGPAGGTAARR